LARVRDISLLEPISRVVWCLVSRCSSCHLLVSSSSSSSSSSCICNNSGVELSLCDRDLACADHPAASRCVQRDRVCSLQCRERDETLIFPNLELVRETHHSTDTGTLFHISVDVMCTRLSLFSGLSRSPPSSLSLTLFSFYLLWFFPACRTL
jgi:hypothetical protein